MANPVYISTNDQVLVTDPYVIFFNLVPRSFSWSNTAQTTYYFVNSTGADIPFTDGTFYYDANSVLTTRLASGASLAIQKNQINNWIQITTPNEIASASSSTAPLFTLPVATQSVLGGIKVGTGLTITNTGVLSATTSGGSGVWGTITGVLTTQTDLNTALNSKLAKSSNLGDLPDTSVARTNLGVPDEFNPIPGANMAITGSYPDLTFSASSGSSPITSFPQLSTLGILTDGSDQTTALNTIFGNSSYEGVIVDFIGGGAITISGTVNAGGKVIIFRAGSTFTGNGTISNAVISATNYQKCFDISVSLSGCFAADNRFSALWYGYVLNTADTTYSLQKSIDTCIANNIRTLFFPNGTYFINQPLVVYNWSGSAYTQVTLRLEGESPFWKTSNSGSNIRVNAFYSGFALGIQLGKGVEVVNMSFQGTFTPPTLTDAQFYTIPFASYIDGICQDNTNAPFSGIVIDPFGASVPGGGSYPNITTYNGTLSYYRGSGSGGSTGCIFEDVVINNFVIGFITSPSGQTANAELLHLFKIQFTNVKCAIVGTQDQEKLNKVEHLACWGGTHTIFGSGGGSDGVSYGNVTPGHWVFDGMNLAGRVNRIISRSGTGYFPMTITHVFAESLGRVGQWYGSLGDSFENSTIDFVDLGTLPAYPYTVIGDTTGSSHFTSVGVTVRNVNMRYYGAYTPLVFNGGFFQNCTFDQIPYVQTSQQVRSVFVDCFAGGRLLCPSSDSYNGYKQSSCRVIGGGKGKYIDVGEYMQGKQIALVPRDFSLYAGLVHADGTNDSSSTYTVSGNTITVTPPTAADLNRVMTGRLAINLTTGQILGIATAAGVSTYTISYAPVGTSSGSGVIAFYCPVVPFSFMGTITAGSPNITDVTIDFGDFTDLISLAGGYLKIPGFYSNNTYTQEGVALSYDSGTGVIVMDRNASFNAADYYFSNGNMQKDFYIFGSAGVIGSGSQIKDDEIFPKGAKMYLDRPDTGTQEFIVTQTGFWVDSPVAVLFELTSL